MFDPCHVTAHFLYSLKTENYRFSDILKGYRKKPAISFETTYSRVD